MLGDRKFSKFIFTLKRHKKYRSNQQMKKEKRKDLAHLSFQAIFSFLFICFFFSCFYKLYINRLLTKLFVFFLFLCSIQYSACSYFVDIKVLYYCVKSFEKQDMNFKHFPIFFYLLETDTVLHSPYDSLLNISISDFSNTNLSFLLHFLCKRNLILAYYVQSEYCILNTCLDISLNLI